MWAIVPVKQFRLAKGRLADLLTGAERAELSRAMALDVLTCLSRVPELEQVLVVSSEVDARALTDATGAQLIPDVTEGLIAAVTLGATTALRAGATGVLIVPGDLPLARPEDFSAVLQAHGQRAQGAAAAVTLSPDDQEDGTNCLACSPANLIEFMFGVRSFAAHQAAARKVGVAPEVVSRPGLALDVDTGDDLARLCEHPGSGHAVAFLDSSGIASRIRAALQPATAKGLGSTA